MKGAIITTGRKIQEESIKLAKEISAQLKIEYVERNKESIEKLKVMHRVENVLIAKKNTLRLISDNEEIFFHPNMSHLRIKNLISGEGDRMIEAMELQPSMKVLDCTLGLGSDAIVASYITGIEVTALEINPYLATVIEYGMKNYTADNEKVISAMRRVKVVNEDHFKYLSYAQPKSFDVVYFDPMFRHSLTKSKNFNPIRTVADDRAVTIETIELAKRVAKKKVVLKENAKSLEFERLGFKKVIGGKYSPIHYGVIEI